MFLVCGTSFIFLDRKPANWILLLICGAFVLLPPPPALGVVDGPVLLPTVLPVVQTARIVLHPNRMERYPTVPTK